MKRPKGLRDGVDLKHSIFSLLGTELRKALVELISIDHPIDDHMANVNTLGPDLSSEASR